MPHTWVCIFAEDPQNGGVPFDVHETPLKRGYSQQKTHPDWFGQFAVSTSI